MRFPEFDGEYLDTTLSELASIVGGGTPDTTVPKYWNGEIQWFTPSEIGKHKYVLHSERTISKDGLNNSSAKLLPKNTILLSTRATIGEASIAKAECCTNQGFQSLIANSKRSDNEYLYYLVATLKKELIRRSCGSTFLEISANEVRRIKAKIPSLLEQQKISSFLSLLDKRIDTQIKIIEKLESLIRGIVQAHYSQCDCIKQVRFSELGESFTTMNISKEDLSDDGNECILYGELFTTYGCVINDIKSKTHISTDKATISQSNDLLFPASTTVDAMSLIAPSAICKVGVILGGDLFGIHVNKNYNNEYLSYLINYIYKSKLARYAQGSTIIHLHHSDIKNAMLLLPAIEEQNYLAHLMKGMEEKIEIEKDMLSKFYRQKAYLLSKLFI